MKTLRRSIELALPADEAWTLVKRVDTFRFLTKPFGDVDRSRPHDTLVEGRTLRLGARPGYVHTIEIARVDDVGRRLETRERGDAVRVWNHTITVEPVGGATCRYTDRVEIDAGPLTPVVYAAAEALYALRRRRWPALVARQP